MQTEICHTFVDSIKTCDKNYRNYRHINELKGNILDWVWNIDNSELL